MLLVPLTLPLSAALHAAAAVSDPVVAHDPLALLAPFAQTDTPRRRSRSGRPRSTRTTSSRPTIPGT
jgi:hypothetical protein